MIGILRAHSFVGGRPSSILVEILPCISLLVVTEVVEAIGSVWLVFVICDSCVHGDDLDRLSFD